jgi:N-acyl-D-amino-acid deacylase
MSEDNVRRLDRASVGEFRVRRGFAGNDGIFLKSSAHPRAYGNFARVYARYVRDERLLPVEQAVHKMTSLPASVLGIAQRGILKTGYFADVVVFDSQPIQDHATFEKPMQYATGVSEVWVYGDEVIRDGEHTGAKPGRVVRRER